MIHIKRLLLIALMPFMISQKAEAGVGDKLCVTVDNVLIGVEVKKEPSKNSDTIMIIGSGRLVIEFGRKNGYVRAGVARSGGRDGYILESLLSDKDLDGLPCGS